VCYILGQFFQSLVAVNLIFGLRVNCDVFKQYEVALLAIKHPSNFLDQNLDELVFFIVLYNQLRV